MRQKTINIYQFKELPEDIQEKAIQNNYDINVFYEWWDFIDEEAEQIGLRITEFGDYSLTGKFTLSPCEVAQNILNNHGETCETYQTAEKFLEKWQPVYDSYMDESSLLYESIKVEDQLMDKLMDIEDEFLKSLCEDYRNILKSEYEYLTSEEAIKEALIANEYEFYESGAIV